MRIYQSILSYLLIFLTLSLVMKLFGIISLTGSTIISYGLISFGIGSVCAALGKDQKITLFLGTIIFLTGILVYVLNNYLVFYHPYLILPSSFFIAGSAFLMLFIDNTKRIKSLVTGVVLILTGICLVYLGDTSTHSPFYNALFNVAGSYWTVIFVSLVMFLIILWEERKE